MSSEALADLQSSRPGVAKRIDWVGVSHLRQPLLLLDRGHAKQDTVADLALAVDLDASARGAHLSRLLDTLAEVDHELTTRAAPGLLDLRCPKGVPTSFGEPHANDQNEQQKEPVDGSGDVARRPVDGEAAQGGRLGPHPP